MYSYHRRMTSVVSDNYISILMCMMLKGFCKTRHNIEQEGENDIFTIQASQSQSHTRFVLPSSSPYASLHQEAQTLVFAELALFGLPRKNQIAQKAQLEQE